MVRRARPHTFKGFLPSLDRVFITQPTLSGDWSPFTDFLSRRAAFGNRISSLKLDDRLVNGAPAPS